MRLIVKVILLLLVISLLLFGCVKKVSEEEAFTQLNELSDEELDAALTEDEAVAGQAYKVLSPKSTKKVQQAQQVAKKFTWLECADTDGGLNYEVLGTVTTEYLYDEKPVSKSLTDQCLNITALQEYSCKGKTLARSTTQCAFGCANGACKAFQHL